MNPLHGSTALVAIGLVFGLGVSNAQTADDRARMSNEERQRQYWRDQEDARRTGCPVHEVWGMTELAGATSANPVYGLNKPGTIGLPYPGNAFRVVDMEDAMREMPRGQQGELMDSGPLVMLGYHNNPTATAETGRPDGWLHTGATPSHNMMRRRTAVSSTWPRPRNAGQMREAAL